MTALHAACGALALLLGAAALVGVRGAQRCYRLLVLATCATAVALCLTGGLPTGLRGALGAVALLTAVTACRRSAKALRASYVSLVAATAFVSAPPAVGAAVVALGVAWVHGPRRRVPACPTG